MYSARAGLGPAGVSSHDDRRRWIANLRIRHDSSGLIGATAAVTERREHPETSLGHHAFAREKGSEHRESTTLASGRPMGAKSRIGTLLVPIRPKGRLHGKGVLRSPPEGHGIAKSCVGLRPRYPSPQL
jgi:hypothetical protein